MAFLAGKILFTGLFSNLSAVSWWSLEPPASLAAGIAGGAVALLNERLAVILLTSFLGSYLAGSVLPWKYFPLVMFALSAPIQWWIQAGRPLHLPFRKNGRDY